MPAFEGAVDLGYRYVETDVHVTADGVLVAFHDDHLDRVTDRDGRDRRAPVDARSARPGSTAASRSRRLEDLLGTWPELRVNIDPKHDEVGRAASPTVLRRTGAVDRVCVGSFSDRRLDRLRADARPGPVHVARARRRGPAAGRQLRPSAASPRPARCAQVPPPAKGVTLVDERFVRDRPPPRPRRCTCGPSTTPTRCTGCSTSASTGS